MDCVRRIALSSALALVFGLTPADPPAARADALMDAVKGGTPSLDLRYRYETVDQTGIADSAQASTARARLGYVTAPFHGVRALLELESTTVVDGDEYNSTVNGKTTRPIVADPDGNDLNRAALLASAGPVDGTLGRQRIILDNARFVGNVGWRQNEQTFDAVRLDTKPMAPLTATYIYLWNVDGITLTQTRHDSHLIHLAYQVPKAGTLSAYGYLLANRDAPSASSQTVGLRYAGTYDLTPVKLGVTAEYARQSEIRGSGIGDSSYGFGELSATATGVTAQVGYELLGGDGTTAFQTPLATKHAFNGWADKFLTTPSAGLVDRMLTLSGKVAGIKLVGVYHDFSADRGGADYGTEVDLLAARKFGPHTVGVKYATYQADTFATDTDKLWLFAETGF